MKNKGGKIVGCSYLDKFVYYKDMVFVLSICLTCNGISILLVNEVVIFPFQYFNTVNVLHMKTLRKCIRTY